MDSEGIWKACTMKVITKIAITTVPSKDCIELITSVPRLVTMRRRGAATGTLAGERTGTLGGAITSSGATSGRSGETTGWFDKSMKSTYPSTARSRPFLDRLLIESAARLADRLAQALSLLQASGGTEEEA